MAEETKLRLSPPTIAVLVGVITFAALFVLGAILGDDEQVAEAPDQPAPAASDPDPTPAPSDPATAAAPAPADAPPADSDPIPAEPPGETVAETVVTPAESDPVPAETVAETVAETAAAPAESDPVPVEGSADQASDAPADVSGQAAAEADPPGSVAASESESPADTSETQPSAAESEPPERTASPRENESGIAESDAVSDTDVSVMDTMVEAVTGAVEGAVAAGEQVVASIVAPDPEPAAPEPDPAPPPPQKASPADTPASGEQTVSALETAPESTGTDQEAAAAPVPDTTGPAAAPVVRQRVARTAPDKPAPEQAAPDSTPPSFDVVTVAPSGSAVIAGRAEPGAEVSITEGEKDLGTVTADRRGEWVLIPTLPLAPGTRELGLESTSRTGVKTLSREVVVLVVPERAPPTLPEREAVEPASMATAADSPLAVLMPRAGIGDVRLLQGAVPKTGLVAEQGLSLDVLNYDVVGQVDFAGKGRVGSQIAAYVNNRLIGMAAVAADGTWRVVPSEAISPGLYTLRVDQIDDSGAVVARLETPFSMADFEHPAVGEGLVVVQPGNSLWRIARRLYGQGTRYSVIFGANHDQIRDPDLIYPGQIFVVPDES
ncbi:MAG: LysM peptidoglycan-binding domain-containing protein [Alphaproteobacteria bacterium]|nr:LysM peptidoglycan-binding domain-containing protein [Alphaproteobacteria bacterium]MDP6518185.1 LysM peptidoglycan-binding domain-containing protein [Alphaproteobacteria bacterium]